MQPSAGCSFPSSDARARILYYELAQQKPESHILPLNTRYPQRKTSILVITKRCFWSMYSKEGKGQKHIKQRPETVPLLTLGFRTQARPKEMAVRGEQGIFLPFRKATYWQAEGVTLMSPNPSKPQGLPQTHTPIPLYWLLFPLKPGPPILHHTLSFTVFAVWFPALFEGL